MSNTKGDDNTNKKQKSKWTTSYSKMTQAQAEQRLNIRLDEIPGMFVDEMLATAKHSLKKADVDAMKEKIYERLLEVIEGEGYPTEANAEFKVPNVNDLVFTIVLPMVTDVRRKTGRSLRLVREKEIVSTDNVTGGEEEFIVMDRIQVTEQKFVLIVEGKRSSTGEGRKQCLLAMKDAWGNNGFQDGFLYGFVTTGEHWEMFRYDGTSFSVTERLSAIFQGMERNKKRWIDNYSAVVDCLYSALCDGGIVRKDVVVR
ncbi:hypothetical protein DFH27DRAFT_361544 [Peziza echinospora]|nr:hypothetical protein DFH27DRAFT_361544 [Peziza echinospora]